jgi:4a-hydroxytetrahydrobiopterin dehydratase
VRYNELMEQHLPEWQERDNAITREFEFKDFVAAFDFMTAVAKEAEMMQHHPDWSNSYNKVTITLSTHSQGGVTDKDIQLARKIDELFASRS